MAMLFVLTVPDENLCKQAFLTAARGLADARLLRVSCVCVCVCVFVFVCVGVWVCVRVSILHVHPLFVLYCIVCYKSVCV